MNLKSDIFRPKSCAAPRLSRLNGVRTLVVLLMAFGYASTMARGPESQEFGQLFGYPPSLLAIQALFVLSGYLALRSLHHHGSGLRLLWRRAKRILPPLALVTALVAFGVYPAIAHDTGMGTMGVWDRVGYVLLTISCVDPSNPMPGALDEARYMCLLQGAIWTLRWGAAAMVGTALCWSLGLLKRPALVLAGALAAMGLFGWVHLHAEKTDAESLETVVTGLRLAWPFAVGLAAYAWRDRLPVRLGAQAMCIAIPLAIAGLNATFLAWTPAIEIALGLAAGATALFAVRSAGAAGRWLEGWPPLALPLFLVNWPVAQLWLYLRPDTDSLALIALTLATACAIAIIAIQLPMLRRAGARA